MKLFSRGLLSKWGFNDGDVLSDYMFNNLDIPDWGEEIDVHRALEELVKTYLLPKLNHWVELMFINTIHNPVRAVTIDGEDVAGGWYDVGHAIELLPEYVEVTADQVMDVIQKHGYVPEESS